MKKGKLSALAALCLAVSVFLTLPGCDSVPNGVHGGDLEGGLSVAERKKEFVTVATGPTSGIYYPIGGASARSAGVVAQPRHKNPSVSPRTASSSPCCSPWSPV